MKTHSNIAKLLTTTMMLLGSAFVACGEIDAGTETIEANLTATPTPGGASVLQTRATDVGAREPDAIPTEPTTSGVYRDAHGNCQLGTGDENHDIVRGAELLACDISCGPRISTACAVEDGRGGCEVVCNCDPLHTSCDDIERERGGGGGVVGGPATTQGIGF